MGAVGKYLANGLAGALNKHSPKPRCDKNPLNVIMLHLLNSAKPSIALETRRPYKAGSTKANGSVASPCPR